MTYRVLGRLGWEEQERTDDVTSSISHEHHSRSNTLLSKASDIRSDHGQSDGKASCESDKYPKPEELTSLIGAVADKK